MPHIVPQKRCGIHTFKAKWIVERLGTGVGKINNHNKITHKKFDEKGYFEFGGSTIVLLLENPIKFDNDIIERNKQGLEVKVSAGEIIGVKEKKDA